MQPFVEDSVFWLCWGMLKPIDARFSMREGLLDHSLQFLPFIFFITSAQSSGQLSKRQKGCVRAANCPGEMQLHAHLLRFAIRRSRYSRFARE